MESQRWPPSPPHTDEDDRWSKPRAVMLKVSTSSVSFEGSETESEIDEKQTKLIESYVSEKTYYLNVMAQDGRERTPYILKCFSGVPVLGSIQWLLSEAIHYYAGTGYRSYSHYTGNALFPFDYDGIKHTVLSSPDVQEVLNKLIGQSSIRFFRKSDLNARAEVIFNEMAATFRSEMVARTLAYGANVLFQQFYSGVHVHEADFECLKQIALKAQSEGISLVFLPSHKSHLDYIVLAYVFFRLGISFPLVAAGENLKLPFVGAFLRCVGAFFIRREFGQDELYKVIVNTYVETLLKHGFNLEFFIEGGRSRTGKLLKPKFGILKMVMNCVLSKRVKDVYLVPISIGHDRVMETEGFINELLGQKKQAETVTGLAKQSKNLINPPNMGRVNIRIAQPFSLVNYIDLQMTKRVNFDPYQSPACATHLLTSLAYKILEDINSITVITPTMLVGTILLTTRGRGISREDLIRRVDWLRAEIIHDGGKVAKFKMETTGDVVDRAVQVLGNLVGVKMLVQPVYIAVKRFELSYYRNAVSHIFVRRGLLALSVYAYIKLHKAKEVNKTKLIPYVEYLTQLLKLEFVFKGQSEDSKNVAPRSGADTRNNSLMINFENGFSALVERNVFKVKGDMVQLFPLEMESWSENFTFLCMLLWPIVESYWLASVSLLALDPDELVEEKAFLSSVLDFASTLYYQGDLNYYESISSDALVNSYVRFADMNIIQRRPCHGESGGPMVISLCDQYKDADQIKSVCAAIGKFRRIGRYRKETQDLSERIVNLLKLARTKKATKSFLPC